MQPTDSGRRRVAVGPAPRLIWQPERMNAFNGERPDHFLKVTLVREAFSDIEDKTHGRRPAH